MDFNEYQEKALRTMAKYNTKQEQIMNAALGLAGESGEVCDLIKKAQFKDDKTPDITELKKEIGDILWYIAEMCDAYGFTMEEVATLNLAKLAARHGDTFSGTGNRTGLGK